MPDDAIDQAGRPLAVTTPLGKNDLLLIGVGATEVISQLFSFQLDLLAKNKTEIPFDKLLGQKITAQLALPNGGYRYFNGICNRVSQGEQDNTFTYYRMSVVPSIWLLTHRAQSRIFQQVNVPDILKKVLEEFDVGYELEGTFEKRDYCVQYRETDFHFISRLMEEEGIYYYFKHEADSHKMVVANTPRSHVEVPGAATLLHESLYGGNRVGEDRVFGWERAQELRSGKYTLWDHHFELPHKHLEATKAIQESVMVGTVEHKLKVGNNDKLEIYDWPGKYAQRFDGVAPGGGDQAADLQKIFSDNKRTAEIRMQQQAAPGIVIRGASSCRQISAGHKFSLSRHPNADGPYVVLEAYHTASMPASYRSGDAPAFTYQNSFTCMPFGVPYRPPQVTSKPVIQGTQSAVVVGPAGQEIFTDKYGRIKVQFHWDREGKNDASSSCWVRVSQPWAGKRWGSFFLPRIGQEVVIDFQEGDPDQPICIGSVYNADQMHPYLGDGFDSKHPNDPKLTGVKSNTTPGGQGFNEWRFDDTKGKEQIFFHAQRDMDERVLNDTRECVLHDRNLIVGSEKDGSKTGDQRELVYQDKHLKVHRHQIEHVAGNMELRVGGGDDGDGSQDIAIAGTRTEAIGGEDHLHITKDRKQQIDGSTSLTVKKSQQEKVGEKHALDAGQEIHLKSGMKLILEAGAQITLKGPGGFVDIGPAGVTIQGTMVLINSGGSAGSGSGSSPDTPNEPKQANPTKPDVADDSRSGSKSAP
jgi:type VI secretion system secreted protein VgrG